VERANLITDNAQLRAQLETAQQNAEYSAQSEAAAIEREQTLRAEIDQLNNLLTAAYMKLDQLDEPAPEWTAEEWEAFKKEHGIVSYRIKYTHGDGR
jgi:hypothetical protein